jgi:iron(III) transport system permease protein
LTAFFLWAGVRAPGWLARAKTIYALCGEVRAADPSRLAVLRAAPRSIAAQLWLVVRTDLPGRRIAAALLATLLFVPLYLQAAAWQAGFGLQGWYTEVWHGQPLLEGMFGAAWIHAMAALPWVVLIVGAGLWLVEPELEEQALLDASPWRVFVHVTARGAAASLLVAALWVLLGTAGEMTVTDLFQVRTYAEEVYTSLSIGSLAESSLELLPGVLLTAWLAGAGLGIAARLSATDRPPSLRPRRVFRLGAARWPLAICVGLFLAAVVGVPLANLLYQAGAEVTQTDLGRVRGWSLLKTLAIGWQSPWRFGREFGWSLLISGLSAGTAVVVGAALAWWGRDRGPRRAIVLLAVGLALAVPGPILGLATIRLFNRPGLPALHWLYDRSIAAPWLVLSVRGLGPATLVLWHALRSVPRVLLDAAAVDGAGPAAQLGRIVVPSRLGAFGLAWLLAFAVALADLAASILVVPPGVTTLSIQIFNLLHYGVYDRVAGICLALVGCFAILCAVMARLAPRLPLFARLR